MPSIKSRQRAPEKKDVKVVKVQSKPENNGAKVAKTVSKPEKTKKA